MTKIPTPEEHAVEHKARADAHLESLRSHVVDNLRANGDAEEHIIDVSRHESHVVGAITEECAAAGWSATVRTDKDKSVKLVLRGAKS